MHRRNRSRSRSRHRRSRPSSHGRHRRPRCSQLVGAVGDRSGIAPQVGIQAKSVTDEEAPRYLGFLAGFAGLDNPTSNDKTRALLGWEPTHPGWVEDVQTGHYFA
jgi:hypothetical protein